MKELFTDIIDSYLNDHIGIDNNFLSKSLAKELKQGLIDIQVKKLLKVASIGNNDKKAHDLTVRGDQIYWLDRIHNKPCENAFFDLIDSFVSYLNKTCYTGITSYEFHYTLYETGSFYKKHLDQFQNNDSRKFSMVIYLNDNWLATDGGELCIHHQGTVQHISPDNRKGVFFKSDELFHEVLTTNKPRMSITGWLKVNPLN